MRSVLRCGDPALWTVCPRARCSSWFHFLALGASAMKTDFLLLPACWHRSPVSLSKGGKQDLYRTSFFVAVFCNRNFLLRIVSVQRSNNCIWMLLYLDVFVCFFLFFSFPVRPENTKNVEIPLNRIFLGENPMKTFLFTQSREQGKPSFVSQVRMTFIWTENCMLSDD